MRQDETEVGISFRERMARVREERHDDKETHLRISIGTLFGWPPQRNRARLGRACTCNVINVDEHTRQLDQYPVERGQSRSGMGGGKAGGVLT